tara:strand:- start:175 stop:345 length:171 start_codon:yes stop_codon:yes gene_type:complete
MLSSSGCEVTRSTDFQERGVLDLPVPPAKLVVVSTTPSETGKEEGVTRRKFEEDPF